MKLSPKVLNNLKKYKPIWLESKRSGHNFSNFIKRKAICFAGIYKLFQIPPQDLLLVQLLLLLDKSIGQPLPLCILLLYRGASLRLKPEQLESVLQINGLQIMMYVCHHYDAKVIISPDILHIISSNDVSFWPNCG